MNLDDFNNIGLPHDLLKENDDYETGAEMLLNLKRSPKSFRHHKKFDDDTITILKMAIKKAKFFPSQSEKERISLKTGLTMKQINNWCVNARRRGVH